MENLIKALVELYKKASTQLPSDVVKGLARARDQEKNNSNAYSVLDLILKNIELARNFSLPICQDTGHPNFLVTLPLDVPQKEIKKAILAATVEAAKKGLLRLNAVDSITQKNTGSGIGKEIPSVYFGQHDKDSIIIRLLLKGGGSENVSAQYKLPDMGLNAGRDLVGVRKCVVDAVYRAQGRGCPPGILGVAVGGDRQKGFEYAKKQLFRKLDDKNRNPALAKLEAELYERLNKLGIGPMGIGGQTTVLGVKACAIHRVPASFFVSISYMCWADRRKEMIYEPDNSG